MKLPLDELLSLAERSYIRMETEQLIDECLEQDDFTSFHRLLEELVLAGSSSLVVMREVLQAIRAVKSHLSQEGLGIRQDLKDALAEFNVHLPQIISAEAPEAFMQICGQELQDKAQRTSCSLKVEDEALIREICAEAGFRVGVIAKRLVVINRLEGLVQDWIGGLVYELAHSSEPSVWPDKVRYRH